MLKMEDDEHKSNVGTESIPGPSEESSYIKEILSSEEYASISGDVLEKIENSIQRSFDEFLTKKALYETSKTKYEEDKKNTQDDLEKKTKSLEAVTVELELTKATVLDLEEKLKNTENALSKIQETNKQLQYEWKDLKVQRDLAIDEKESIVQMLDRRNADLSRIKAEMNEINKKYHAAVKAKMVALQNAEEVESLKISLEYKEKRLEQESALLKSQIQTLNEELKRQTTELMNLKRESSAKAVTVEAEISEKTQELAIAKQTIIDLKEENDRLKEKIKSLTEKLNEQRAGIDEMYYNFQQELQAQSKLSELYKGLCEENESKTEKLTNTINELQQLLKEASEQYGDLETKNKQMLLEHQEEIDKKNDCIQLLRKELKDANELLKVAKEENLEAAMATLSPCAASASRLIKSGMTLTQIYSQYATVSEELLLQKEENRKLQLYVTTILSEIEEKAPILKQQRLDYEKALSSIESLTKQMDEMITESKTIEQECMEAKKTSDHLRRENERLKKEISDLSRQVCYLIKAVEEARGGIVSDGFDNTNVSYDGNESSAQLVISRKLVTFGSIEDLQENNQKLLALVRKLSMKQEAAENISSEDYYDLKVKEEKLQARVNDLMEEMDRQSKMMELIRNQSLTFKKLYEQSLGGVPSDAFGSDKLTPVKGGMAMMTSTPKPAEDPKKVEELKKSLKDLEEKYKKLAEEKDKYKNELLSTEKKLTDEINKMKKELTDLLYKNSKLVAQAEFHEEKCKILEGNLTTSKKQIKALEERNQMLSEISAKHEQSMLHLKDEAMDAQTRLSKAEVALESIRQENFLLKNTEFRLLKERETWNREMHSHSMLMTNLDAIKAAFERSEEEGKLRLENQLSEALKECAALRNSLEDEKDRFKELAASLERQTSLAKERMLEEKKAADKARENLDEMKRELESKSKVIEELNRRIRDMNNQPMRSVIESVTVNLDESTKKMKEYENKIKDLEGEINSLQMQLQVTKQHNAQYCEMAQSVEKQLAEANEEHALFRTVTAEKIEDALKKEMALKEKYEELQQKYLAVTKVQQSSTDELHAKLESSSTELRSTSNELSNLRHELMLKEEELKKANEAICKLESSLQEAELKYSNEVVLHSADIQSLAAAKNELTEAKKDIVKFTLERDQALNALKLKEGFWDEQEKKLKIEIQELNERMAALDDQNRSLHESLLELGNQLAILQSRVIDEGQKPVEDTLQCKESVELSSKTQDQLLKVIKFLRQEKDVAITRSELLQSENVRLKGQLAMTTKQLEEVQELLKNTQDTKESSMKASAKHAELLRKIDTLNALTDSNRLLREERDKLKADMALLKAKLEESEAKLPPLLKDQKRLLEKVEALTTENQALLMDVAKWRQKANALAERSNKGTPEDWRRLTNERENLAKQWQLEKNNNEKLEEELRKVKQEKHSLNEQILHIQKNLQNEMNEIRRLTEEANSFKQQCFKCTEELNATKAQLNKVTEESAKLLNEVNSNKNVINDLRAKETQLKKIGKKYKTQYEDLLKTSEEEKKAREEEEKKRSDEELNKAAAIPDDERERLKEEGRLEVKNELTPRITEMEAKLTEKIKELEAKVTSAQEESENLKKDNETLKTSINEKEERAKQVMKTARSKIVQLTEQKNSLEQELKQIKDQTVLSRDESDTKINNLKAQYESIISEMEKERSDQAVERDQERDRLSSQIKSLNQRLNHLQRSLEKQLGSKPSTSSRPADKSTMEPPTANIKPMAGSSSTARQKQKQTTGPVSPCWRSSGNETPFASIRPTISMQTRTVAVLPTSQTNSSQTSSSQSTPVMVLPQQQIVHTTGNSGEALSSSPTSSHTDYMPATSSATPIRQVVVAPPLSVGTHMGSSDAQSTQEMEAEANDNDVQQQTSNQQSQTMTQQQQTQTVAMVLPRERVEQQPSTTQGNQQQSIDQSCAVAYSQANSSNTVTTTQAGLKRPRDVEGDSSTSMEGDEISKAGPQCKRTRVSVTGNQAEVFHHQVTHSEGIEVEYQVPTSSQRDQEDDMIIMVDSEEEGNADEGEVEEPDDEPEFEEEDNGEGYEVGSYSRDGQDLGMATYDEGPDIDEENVPDQDNNEVEVIDDSNEVPNQSGSSRDGGADNGNATQSSNNAAVPVASSIESGSQDQTLQQSSEATSSGPVNSDAGSNVVVVSQAASSQSSQTFRTRNVPPLGRQQQSQLVLPQTYEESGDDGIVPSTPTLFIPRRSDGFGEAVSSPQIPHQASFIFSDPSPPITRSGIPPASVEGSEDGSQLEEPGTGRSVPTTPLQASPQELPLGELLSEVGQSSSGTHAEGEQSDGSVNIPDITVTVVEDDGNSEMPPSDLAHFAGEEEEESNGKGDTSSEEPEIINLDEDNDGVTSEGEKPLSAVGEIEEGREAEASEPFESNNMRRPTGRIGGTARRSGRMGFPRRSQARRPTPIVWSEPGSSSSSMGVGSAIPSVLRNTIQSVRIITPETQRMMPRGRSSRGRKWR